MTTIDINFDFREESQGRDPDRWSPTLQAYHQILWSKNLPNGKLFSLTKSNQNRLYHQSELGEFYLSSDVALYSCVRKCLLLSFVTSKIPEIELQNFKALTTNTIGGMLIWPSTRVDSKITINGIRGFNRLISDRLDLTLECIRRHYSNEPSPLSITLNRYSNFFSVFGDFRGYIDFFLLQDFIDNDEKVIFSLPFDNFNSSPIPTTTEEFKIFKTCTTEKINKRNYRISQFF
jgi:hypothetical protein